MLPALIRAAYAAGGNADCLYQVLVVISKLAALQGFTGKEKIQLYKMIGDLAPKCNEHFEEIWLSLGQIAPNNVGPSGLFIHMIDSCGNTQFIITYFNRYYYFVCK